MVIFCGYAKQRSVSVYVIFNSYSIAVLDVYIIKSFKALFQLFIINLLC